VNVIEEEESEPGLEFAPRTARFNREPEPVSKVDEEVKEE